MMDLLWVWMAIGLLGQLCFSARFVVQWLASERRGRSVVPESFWYLSLGGGIILLIYAIHLGDPVFIIGQGSGLLIYARNIRLSAPAARHPVIRRPGPLSADVAHPDASHSAR